MRFTPLEEYGLRCLLQMARNNNEGSITILELGEKEDLSRAYIAKIMRRLRLGGLVRSTRGQKGGYRLVREPKDISIRQILEVLDGELFSDEFCGKFSGNGELCVHTVDCSIRSLWKTLNSKVGNFLDGYHLSDLMGSETKNADLVPLEQGFKQTHV